MALQTKPHFHHPVRILEHVIALVYLGAGQDVDGIGRLDDSTAAPVDRYNSTVGGPGVGRGRDCKGVDCDYTHERPTKRPPFPHSIAVATAHGAGELLTERIEPGLIIAAVATVVQVHAGIAVLGLGRAVKVRVPNHVHLFFGLGQDTVLASG